MNRFGAASLAIVLFAGLCVSYLGLASAQKADASAESSPNLALVAKASTSFVSGHETITALNNGYQPAHSDDKSHGAYGNWPQSGTQWVRVRVEPADQHRQDRRLLVRRRPRRPAAQGLPAEVLGRQAVRRGRESRGAGPGRATSSTPRPSPRSAPPGSGWRWTPTATFSTGILQWRVYDSGKSPNFPPLVTAGVDRVVVLPGKTYLQGTSGTTASRSPVPARALEQGVGSRRGRDFDDARRGGDHRALLRRRRVCAAADGRRRPVDRLGHAPRRRSSRPPPADASRPGRHEAATRSNSRFWSGRIKKIIVNWIPHCYDEARRAGPDGRRASRTSSRRATSWPASLLAAVRGRPGPTPASTTRSSRCAWR